MDADQIEKGLHLEAIFMPYATAKRAQLVQRGGRFVHYTTAEAGIRIIQGKKIWMRNTKCMADFSEVTHGYNHLRDVLAKSDCRQDFEGALNNCSEGVAHEALGLFDKWWNDINFNTYICSISEHDESENNTGRLSMWRGFGRQSARVALVFSLPMGPGAAEGLNLLLSPVGYFGPDAIERELRNVIKNINDNIEFIRTVERERVIAAIFYMLLAAVC